MGCGDGGVCMCVCVGGGEGGRGEAGRGCNVYAIPVYHLTKHVMLRRYSFNEKELSLPHQTERR